MLTTNKEPERYYTNKIKDHINTYPNSFSFKLLGGSVPGGAKQRPGIPDLYSCINGVSIWIEVKKGNGHVSEYQVEVITELTKAGANVILAYIDPPGKTELEKIQPLKAGGAVLTFNLKELYTTIAGIVTNQSQPFDFWGINGT